MTLGTAMHIYIWVGVCVCVCVYVIFLVLLFHLIFLFCQSKVNMINLLPNELLWNVFGHLSYQDLDKLSEVEPVSATVLYFIQQHYNFHYKTNSLLGLYEAITPTERHLKETKHEFANKILQLICTQVDKLPKFEHRNKFTELLDIVQQFVVNRILADDLKAGLEHDYANLCLEVRSLYLHTPSIRVLHDPVSFLFDYQKRKKNAYVHTQH